jgi:hypothetical protein
MITLEIDDCALHTLAIRVSSALFPFTAAALHCGVRVRASVLQFAEIGIRIRIGTGGSGDWECRVGAARSPLLLQ